MKRKRKRKPPIKVGVTAEDIAEGIAGSCHFCAVAIAVNRATGEHHDGALVYERDWTMYLEVWGYHIVAPPEVRKFVWDFDAQPRAVDDKLDFSHPDCEPPDPFEFEIPDIEDPEWELWCDDCYESFERSKIDDGACRACRKARKAVAR